MPLLHVETVVGLCHLLRECHLVVPSLLFLDIFAFLFFLHRCCRECHHLGFVLLKEQGEKPSGWPTGHRPALHPAEWKVPPSFRTHSDTPFPPRSPSAS